MADHVSESKRSQIMASVKSKNTQPERKVRSLLHGIGYRFLLHDNRLPGKPDIILPKYTAVIFINGCFWHGHGCNLSKKVPETQKDFWNDKFTRNRLRDLANTEELLSQGWRVCTVWECALKRQYRLPDDRLLAKIDRWLKSKKRRLEISGLNRY